MTTQVALPPRVKGSFQQIRETIATHTRYVHRFWLRKHQLKWCDALEDFNIKRLLIIAPPKYGKSPLVGLDYLGWRIGNDPENYHCIYISNTATQAYKYSVALRDAITENRFYRAIYGLTPDYKKGWAENEWFVRRLNESDKDPTLQAVGIHGPILGATVQELIIDDPADEENMSTQYQRDKLMDFIQLTAMSRLMPDNNRVVAIMTRWHEDDPAARWAQAGWHIIHMPAIDDNGASTYPELWNLPTLEAQRSDVNMGERRFQLMFQGKVMPDEGAIFKREWWRYWKQGEAPWQITGEGADPIQAIVQSWDTAHEAKRQADYSACETWVICRNGYYLINAWRGKLEFPQLKAAFENLYDQFKPSACLIEATAAGKPLIQELRQKSRVPVVPIDVSRDKVARAHAVTPVIASENVFVPMDASWRHAWEYEHEVFPNGRNDDFVDCTTQFLNWAREHVVYGETTKLSSIPKKSIWRD